MRKNRIATFSSIATLMAVIVMLSTNANASNNSHKKTGPPPEAFAACQGKEVGDAVTFSGRNGEKVEAVCKEIHDQLVAAPDKMPLQ